MKTIVVLSALALLLLAPPVISQVPDDKLIVPGERIGKWTLQMTINQLRQMHGNPDGTSRSVPLDSAIADPTVHAWTRLGLAAATSGQDPRIVLLVASSNEYRTAKAISVGSTQEATEAAYGKATATTRWTDDLSAARLIYDEIGLTVRFLRGRVDTVYVFPRGAAKGLWQFGSDACVAQPITYTSDGLRITGSLMKPPGNGPFPVVIYNHGSRTGREQLPQTPAGTPCPPFVRGRNWVYFFPDRRGFGLSEGPSLSSVLAGLGGEQAIQVGRIRAQQEASDVIAGIAFLKTLPFVDASRLAIVGYSWGGIVNFLAAATAPNASKAVVNQAAGWSEQYRGVIVQEMIGMGRVITVPILIQHGRDDRDVPVRYSTEIAEGLSRLGKSVTLRLYPGDHEIFASEARAPIGEWGKDLIDFLARHFGR